MASSLIQSSKKVIAPIIFGALFHVCILPAMCQQWNKHVVCTSCPAPLAIDFSRDTGILFTEVHGFRDSTNKYYGVTHAFQTLNGGMDWEEYIDTGNAFTPPRGWNRLILLSEDAVLFSEGMLHISTDLGKSWKREQLPRDIFGMSIKQPLILYALWAGESPYTRLGLRVSNDTGNVWDFQNDLLSSPDRYVFGDGCIINSLDYWANLIPYDTSNNAYIIHTSDGGLTWQSFFPLDSGTNHQVFYASSLYEQNIIAGASLGSIYLINNGVHYASENKRYVDIIFSTDNGSTWHADSTFQNQIAKFYNPFETALWVVLKDTHTLAFSPDNGKTWAVDSVTFKGENIQFMHWEDSTFGGLVTYNDSIISFWKFNSKQGITDINTSAESVFFNFTDHNIHIIGLKEDKYEMTIIDVLGKTIVRTTVFQDHTGIVDVNVSSRLSQGPYFIQLKASDQVIISGKPIRR